MALRSFQVKVTVLVIVAILATIALSNLFVYQFLYTSQFDSLREKLKLAAQVAVLSVDSEVVQKIPLTHEGIQSPEYIGVADQLRRIQMVNPQIKFIYILTKTESDGVWQFVVDPDPAPETHRSGIPTSFPGDRYDASRFPELMKAYETASADHKLEVDEWGVTLSGYAPIVDRAGKTIAVLGLDVLAQDIYEIQARVRERTVVVISLGVILAIFLGVVLSKNIAKPIGDLTAAVEQIGRGNYHYRVQTHSKDEIATLIKAFNDMAQNLHVSRERILKYFYDVVKSLVKILELHDQYTEGHSEAVANYAAAIAKRMGFPNAKIEMLKKMTLLHDIGKLGIQDKILNKNGVLTPEEWAIVKQHPIMGEEILKPILGQEEMLAVITMHHERYDGKGYPNKLAGDQINMFAAIVTVADAYDAMISDRAYRKSIGREQAIEELKRHSGTQFHPKVVEVFLKILSEERV